MRRLLTALACATGLLGAASPAAFADATVGRDGPDVNNPANDDLVYFGDDGGRDDVEIWVQGGELRFQDDFGTIVPGDACWSVDVHTVRCDQTNLHEFRVHVFGGPDDVVLEDDVTVPNELNGGTEGDRIEGSEGTTQITGSAGVDLLDGSGNTAGPTQLIDGGPDEDIISGGSGFDQLVGGDGDDVIRPRASADTISGGAGIDKVTYSERADGVAVSIDSVADDGVANEFDNVSEDVENVTGGTGPDVIVGSLKINTLDGGDGADTLHGGGNTDVLLGRNHVDKLYGEDGLDLLYGGPDGDGLFGGDDPDLLLGENGPDALSGGAGDDVLDGGLGEDEVQGGAGDADLMAYGWSTQPVIATLGGTGVTQGETDDIAPDIESLAGGSGDDELTGDGGANLLRGGLGKDTLTGGGGVDLLRGDAGADTLLSNGDGAVDTDECGGDADTVQADPIDVLNGCEQVEVVQPAGGGDGNGPEAGRPPETAARRRCPRSARRSALRSALRSARRSRPSARRR